jgi:hypothetical protein
MGAISSSSVNVAYVQRKHIEYPPRPGGLGGYKRGLPPRRCSIAAGKVSTTAVLLSWGKVRSFDVAGGV